MDPRTLLADVPPVSAPSPEHPTARHAMEAILDAYGSLPDPGEAGWLSLVAGGEDGPRIQYVQGTINLVQHELDLAGLLRGAGESALADDVEPAPLSGPGRADARTLWRVFAPNSDKVAAILDVAFRQGHDLAADYPLEATFESGGTERPGPGSLGADLAHLSAAGWLLLLIALVAIALVAAFVGPWALDQAGLSSWRGKLPLFVPLLMLPGLLAGFCVYVLGGRLLRRLGVPTERALEAPKP